MKYFLTAVGVSAAVTQSWLYLGPLLFADDYAPLVLTTDEPSDVCTLFNSSTSTCNTLSSFLSIAHTSERAAEIEFMANNLQNEERTWPIDGQDIPIYMGPVARPGSIAEQLQYQDLVELRDLKPDTPELMAALAARWLPQLNSIDAYTRFYELFHPIADAPVESVDHGDVGFGASRLSLRGFDLRAVRDSDADPEDETLTADNVAQICGAGASVDSLRADKKLFVVDLATIGQWGDPSVSKVESDLETGTAQHPTKYLPSVVGYFCFNEQLLPLAIKLVDSGITYTPFDSPEEWQLAKTALNAAEATFQQMQHFAESHTLSIPIRVELYRAFAEKHPVRALLMRHFALDFGLEQQAGVVLFNTSTPLDKTFGIGAAGCVRFLQDARQRISLLDDVYSDVKARGIQHLPHKYAVYGKMHADAISRFVGGFLDVYYSDDEAVRTDVELQQWAAECAKIPHLHDFPQAFKGKERLHQLLTRLVFQSVVKHHAMNGEVTWTTVAMPFSAAALWKPLPNRKERDGHAKIDVFSFLQPREFFPSMIFLSALFNRPRPESTTLKSVYHAAPFTHDLRLQPVIRAYDAELQAIDDFIVANEEHEAQPYHILRPGSLPHNTWI
ncbi:Allene oxide synthase-lipoxygenase protein [Phytophthora cinnamomi]|uniref:Allene oxide synthase-lipoxygenase protein n=1 Tax=Phytophthora cinnamomi TaxID=4785 RepID=UPI0035593D7D|nr:Allene oxide synthase-lipoxygenase protein [Phytophthora cinnamomi]